ncbi:GntR family transcriptional regulator [Micromonospora sp. NPDC018662]|uniref:GntR family transcriptional regulator n=1 Tax=Micromonospora sp. NPDC018662 TaxID=3364238 RepID=UPI00379B6408
MPTPHYGQPRYRTIADELRRRIESGEIAPGTLLPTERALTAEFQASRGTIRKAIAALQSEDLVVTEHGRGTCAIQQRHESVADGKADRGKRQIPADSDLAAIFAIDVGAILIEEQRITRARGTVQEVTRVYRIPLAAQ